MAEQQETDLIDADDIDGRFVPRLKESVTEVEIEDQPGLLDTDTGRALALNQTAELVCAFLDGERTLDQLVADLADAISLAPDVIGEDVTNLVRRLGYEGLLQGVHPVIVVRPAPEPPKSAPLGTEVKEFSLVELSGQLVSREVLLGHRTLLINWSPTCGWCDRIGPDLVAMHDDLAAREVEVVLLAYGTAEANAAKALELGLRARVLLNPAQEVDLFASIGTPAAYLLDEDARVAGELTVGGVDVPALAAELAGRTT
jgi:thiol-disulfide isomerase/thioredoxin